MEEDEKKNVIDLLLYYHYFYYCYIFLGYYYFYLLLLPTGRHDTMYVRMAMYMESLPPSVPPSIDRLWYTLQEERTIFT